MTRRTRALATAAVSGLLLGGLAVAAPSPAGAATLGGVVLTPSTGDSSTLFGGAVDASCPAGTNDANFWINGPGVDRSLGEGFLGAGTNASGTGAQSFNGASLAALNTTDGTYGSGTYEVVFECVNGATITDSYRTTFSYDAAGNGGNGAWTATPLPADGAATAPGAPTMGAATAPTTGGAASISFTAPTDDGGAAISGYEVEVTKADAVQPTLVHAASSPAAVTGLVNGTPYRFRVRANNSAGSGGWSASSNTVIPRAATKLALVSAPAVLTYGVAPKVTGKLTLSNGTTGVAGQAVTMQVRKKGTTSYVNAATASTASTGAVTFTAWKPAYPVDALRLVKSTAGAYLGSVSTAKGVSTQRRITTKWSAAQIALGRTATLSGYVYPRSSGLKLVLQRKSGTSWVTVTSKVLPSTTASYSSYAFAVRPATRGTHYYRLVLAAAGGYAASVGSAPTLKVV